jgi:hypothetical protein
MLAQPQCLGDQFEPMELLVMAVTDQGQRPLAKVARLFTHGQRRAFAEILYPKMFWFKKGQFVLTGAEQVRDQYEKTKCPAQSWLCTLAVDSHADAFKVVHTYRYGAKLTRRELSETYKSSGLLSVNSVIEPLLGRATVRADLIPAGGQAAYGRSSLLDVDLAWMGTDGFELAGFEHVPAHANSAAVTLQQAWLCKLDQTLTELVVPGSLARTARKER